MNSPSVKEHSTKDLMRILIGAAWIDGVIQKEERDYLHRMAKNHDLEEDPDIKAMLAEIKPITPQECYTWIQDYLGDRYSQEDYQSVLEAISGLIYSDGEVQTQEARFLLQLQELDPEHLPQSSLLDSLLKATRRLYRKALADDR